MEPREALRRYLFGHHSLKTGKVTSCFKAALCDARKTTRRQSNGTTKKSGTNHGNWLGAIGYMTLLDQIGNCLKPKDKAQSKYKTGLKRALDYFSDLPETEINALYALRCSFAHDYSLINIDSHYDQQNKQKDKLSHRFHVNISGKIVDLPSKKWDRNFKNRSNVTSVNLVAFGDLVEQICQEIKKKYQEGELELSLPVEEFMEKYFFHTYHT
jgi:hypothetical protein